AAIGNGKGAPLGGTVGPEGGVHIVGDGRRRKCFAGGGVIAAGIAQVFRYLALSGTVIFSDLIDGLAGTARGIEHIDLAAVALAKRRHIKPGIGHLLHLPVAILVKSSPDNAGAPVGKQVVSCQAVDAAAAIDIAAGDGAVAVAVGVLQHGQGQAAGTTATAIALVALHDVPAQVIAGTD